MTHSSVGNLDVKLDRNSDVPLGTQLAWKLRGSIAAGLLSAGDRLPGVRELALSAGVNVNTVRSVYGRLAEQGLIVAEHGRGTFVSPAVRDEVELRRLAERTAREASAHGVDPRELAAALYAQPAQRRRGSGSARAGAGGEAGARNALRIRIADLESDLAELDRELVDLGEEPVVGPERPRRRPRGPRILSIQELEAIADDLAARAGERRHRIAEAHRRRRRWQLEEVPRASSVPDHPPELIVNAGTWTLRWKA